MHSRLRSMVSIGEGPKAEVSIGEFSEWQTEQHEKDAQDLLDAFETANVQFIPQLYIRRSINFDDIVVGFTVFAASPVLLKALDVLKSWIIAREGRRFRLKKDGVEIEANSVANIDKIIDRLKSIDDDHSGGED